MSSLSVADFLVTISLKIRTEARNPFAQLQRNSEITRRHQAGFYSDDGFLLDDVAHFIGTALHAGNAALVVATELHRNGLLPKLEAQAWILLPLLSRGKHPDGCCRRAFEFMINGMPDPARFLNFFGNLIVTAAHAAKREQARVAVFGKVFIPRGHKVTQRRRFGSELSPIRYPRRRTWVFYAASLGGVQSGTLTHIFQEICARIQRFIPDEPDLTQILDSNTGAHSHSTRRSPCRTLGVF